MRGAVSLNIMHSEPILGPFSAPPSPPVLTAGKCLWGSRDSPRGKLAPTLCSSPGILAQDACQWCRRSLRPVTWSTATCITVPSTCPCQPLEQRDESNGFDPGHSSEQPGPRDSDLIRPESGLGMRTPKGAPDVSNLHLQPGFQPATQHLLGTLGPQ